MLAHLAMFEHFPRENKSVSLVSGWGTELSRVLLAMACCLATGCGTTRMTDTQRAASEMLLISQAIDNAVGQLDLSELMGQKVFLDTQYLDGAIDKGYLISALRQHLLAHGALIQEERAKADIIVEPRSGAIGTDKYSLLIGTPQMSVPTVMAGVPTQIPEIALVKKTDQKGIAKLAVFAYDRRTGRAVWQSGLVQAKSNLKDTWVFGAGPFSRGSIRETTELAGEELPKLPLPFLPSHESSTDQPMVTPAGASQPAKKSFSSTAYLDAVPYGLLSLTGPAALLDKPILPVVKPSPLIISEPPPGLFQNIP